VVGFIVREIETARKSFQIFIFIFLWLLSTVPFFNYGLMGLLPVTRLLCSEYETLKFAGRLRDVANATTLVRAKEWKLPSLQREEQASYSCDWACTWQP